MSGTFILKTIASVLACKSTRGVLRLMGRGGTALPGKAAMVFDKKILETVSEGMEIIVVTGTNGKTTTCRMIEHGITSGGVKCLANKSGANLLSGVTAELTANATLFGKPKTKYAVIECDEGALKQVVPLLHPKVIVVTNLFRDQLDRYGEVMHTLDSIRVGIEKVPEAVLCLNADCSLTSSLALNVPNKIVYYGINQPVGEQKDQELSDARHCIRCGAVYGYHSRTYAHLGKFYCPSCGYARKDPECAVEEILSLTAGGSEIKMNLFGEEAEVLVHLPAVYNIYNAAAALCALLRFGISREQAIRSLSDVHSSFGRMENFDLGGIPVQMILVKNPAGCNQTISYLTSLTEDFNLVICLNDRTADGHDISWIWDADYEKLAADAHVNRIYVAGERAEDLQLRLKYAGADEDKIVLRKDYKELLSLLKESTLPVFAMPNYTSMLTLRAILAEATGKKEFWEG